MNRVEYNDRLKSLMRNPPHGFDVMASHYEDSGQHPESFIDYECAFAASMLRNIGPRSILDVGSYRHFVMGLAAHYDVTSVDVRRRKAVVNDETMVECDSKNLRLDSGSFDAVVSLCSLEHFGLGRYGDEYDLAADAKAFDEMRRVLKPGGFLVFSTTLGAPCICFNAHRIYSYQMITGFCDMMTKVSERVFVKMKGVGLTTKDPAKVQSDFVGYWDVYMGCWQK